MSETGALAPVGRGCSCRHSTASPPICQSASRFFFRRLGFTL